jgi:hypothetical protein
VNVLMCSTPYPLSVTTEFKENNLPIFVVSVIVH